jgi:hypothetical protein
VRDGGAPGAAEEDATKGEEDDEEDEGEEKDQDEDERPFPQLLPHASLQLDKPRLRWVFQLCFVSHKIVIHLSTFPSVFFSSFPSQRRAFFSTASNLLAHLGWHREV